MTALLMKDIENQLSADIDGSYKERLLALLKEQRDAFSSKKQGFLPPEEYQLAEDMERAANAAISVIQGYTPVKSDPDDVVRNDSAFNHFIYI